jgi:hypothetical protein
MRKILLCASAILALSAGSAKALAIVDPTGDFLPTYAGPLDADLDVTAFSVDYNAATETFLLNATLAGDVDRARPGLYVIGVNTGAGAIRPFGSIGAPNVIFDEALVIQKTGMGVSAIGGRAFTAAVFDNKIAALIPLSFLATTGFAPDHYGFNIWPRSGFNPADNTQVSDFAPNNATLAAVPEPAAWSLMITGFGVAGGMLRRRRVHPMRA